MANFRSVGRLLALLLISIHHTTILAVPCYRLDGREATPDTQACNLNATGGGGSHSACCKVMNQDACLSTGLCLNTLATQSSHFLWATGCTDPTFLDPSCPKYCRTTGWSNARLQNCNDTHYCCAEWDIQRDQTGCCNSSFPLDGPIGIITRQIHSTDTNLTATSGNDTSSDNNTVETALNTIPTRAIVGLSVEGAALLIALMMLLYVLWSRRRLNEEVNRLNRALTAGGSGNFAQAFPRHPNEVSELPLNPQELPTQREPSEMRGDTLLSRGVGWQTQK
ncbi:hypothetical protein F4859DRAFT_224673 [Xylaria cf. heliscus]|nr:hypothetical protein F4859DRAFT_224673 [Xylaria cf. heliscus]